MGAHILIVDDEADIRRLVDGILRDEGYETRMAGTAQEAEMLVADKMPDLVILDIWLEGSAKDGLQILSELKARDANLPVLMISGHGTIETAVSAIKEGAYDFIEKPFKSDRLLLMVRRALETAALRKENAVLKQQAQDPDAMDLIGSSPAIELLRDALGRVAQSKSRVLITGEAGTGKNLAARMVHALSDRAGQPFRIVNCAALQPERLELELFGNLEGETGVLQLAHGGTVFLDEVSDMPLETQAKIVRALQEYKFKPIGAKNDVEIDVRFVAASHKNLSEEVAAGRFREDLYYRLNVVPVHVPPLREFLSDLPLLVEHFLEVLSQTTGVRTRSFSSAALALMQAYDWPGNVRQLRNVVEWVLIMHGDKTSEEIQVSELPAEVSGIETMPEGQLGDMNGAIMGCSLREARELFERSYLQAQIERFDGNVSKTAEFVGMERSALHRKIKSLEIDVAPKGVVSSQSQKRA